MCVEGFHTDRFFLLRTPFCQNHKVQDQVGQIYTVINIIKIKELANHFARCGLTDRSVAIQILTLLMWQNFTTERGTQQKKNGRYGNPQPTKG
jgi:hypothetical protein